ncbi:DNA translocase FtsK 4TM domain-containing protein, partial [Frigidibacter oleivorans]|uniref:DNA translocase FtsK 4TM domain-containing protein n=1 Tax=Frigidibacter oleivorans TaxID=2487129 RepID=UPI00197A74EE
MASYQARQRDPLLDQNTQAVLERRGKELLGGALIVLGVLTAMMLGSYSPDDPSFLAATDEPAQNLLGGIGAAIASPLYVIAGHGAWGLSLCLLGWGLRFMLHRGEERAAGRVIFAPIGVALMSVYASTLLPGPEWTHSFGLGGLFGDTVLGALIGVAPVKATFGLKVISLLVFAAMLAVGAFVLGFDRAELTAIRRFLLVGSVIIYARLLNMAGRGADLSMRAAQAAAEKARERRAVARDRAAEAAQWDAAERAVPEPRRRALPAQAALQDHWQHEDEPAPPPRRVLRAEPAYAAPEEDDLIEDEPVWDAAPAPRQGLLARVSSQIRRVVEPEPELVEPPLLSPRAALADAPPEERIRARIADAVKSRSRLVADPRPGAPVAPAAAAAPRRMEPPVTAAAAAAAG